MERRIALDAAYRPVNTAARCSSKPDSRRRASEPAASAAQPARCQRNLEARVPQGLARAREQLACHVDDEIGMRVEVRLLGHLRYETKSRLAHGARRAPERGTSETRRGGCSPGSLAALASTPFRWGSKVRSRLRPRTTPVRGSQKESLRRCRRMPSQGAFAPCRDDRAIRHVPAARRCSPCVRRLDRGARSPTARRGRRCLSRSGAAPGRRPPRPIAAS